MSAALPTSEERPKLNELRSRVGKDYPECDQLLLAWLRAREMDVDKAEEMLRHHLVWRKNNEISKLKDWRSPKAFLPYLHSGSDFENRPIFLWPVGRWDIRGLIEFGDILPALKFLYQCLENFKAAAIQQKVYQGVIICDFDGFGYRQIAHRTVVQGMIEVLRVFETNYPESLKAAYIINAPKVFSILFAILKTFLHARTLRKIHIFGPDPEKWQSALFKTMAKDQLPPHWGGTKPGVDEYCSDAWFREPLRRYFLRKSSVEIDSFGEEWYSVKVAAQEQLIMEYDAKRGAECTLKWAFTTDGYDIGFSIYNSEENKYVISYKRVDSHINKIEGSLTTTEGAKYRMTFDNSYSRSRAKTLHNCISFISNEEEIADAMDADSTSSRDSGGSRGSTPLDDKFENVFLTPDE